MGDRRRNDETLKKDHYGSRDDREEINETIRSAATAPLQKQPNRDRARGDWDRSGDHHDASATSDEDATSGEVPS